MADPVLGLDFPLNETPNSDIRLMWDGAVLLPRFNITVIWKSRMVAMNGFHGHFWFSDYVIPFPGNRYNAGFHPYPTDGSFNPATGESTGGLGDTGTTHYYEIAGLGTFDFIQGPGGPIQVIKDGRWVTHAFTIELSGDTLIHTFRPDLENDPTNFIQVNSSLSQMNAETRVNPFFALGGSVWQQDFPSAGRNNETPGGVISFLRFFTGVLSQADQIAEATSTTLNTPATAAGAASVFYINDEPVPTDVLDKSGQGNHPRWDNANRPNPFGATGGGGGGGGNKGTLAQPITDNAGFGATPSAALGSAPTPGNIITAKVMSGGGTPPRTPPAGWTTDQQIATGGSAADSIAIFSRLVQAGDPATFSCVSDNDEWSVQLSEHVGPYQDPAKDVDGQTAYAGSGTQMTITTSAPTTQADTLAVAYFYTRDSGNAQAQPNWTDSFIHLDVNNSSFKSLASAYKVLSTVQTPSVTPTWSNTAGNIGGMVVYKFLPSTEMLATNDYTAGNHVSPTIAVPDSATQVTVRCERNTWSTGAGNVMGLTGYISVGGGQAQLLINMTDAGGSLTFDNGTARTTSEYTTSLPAGVNRTIYLDFNPAQTLNTRIEMVLV